MKYPSRNYREEEKCGKKHHIEPCWEIEYDQWRKDFDFTKIETRKEIDKIIDAKLIELLNKQSAKIQQQAEDNKELTALAMDYRNQIETLSSLLSEAMSKVEELHNIHPHNISGVLSWWRHWFVFEEKVNGK